jgi:hypothetical protein
MAWSKPKIAVAALIVLVILNGGILLTLFLLRQSPDIAPTAAPATATLLVYEPFDYPAGAALVGQTNGAGFAGPWEPGGFNAQLSDVFNMETDALAYPNLATRGANHLSVASPPTGVPAIAGVGRLLRTNLATPGATYYLSFLHRPDGEEEYASVVLGTGQGNELSVGKSGSVKQYHISQRGGMGRVYSGVEPVVGKTVFIVVKMEFKDGPDRFTLYLNPTPGNPEPATGAVKDDLDLEFAEQLFLYSRAAWSVDEIRLGTTWEAVTPARKEGAR